jgi:hypothetical protein
MKRLLRLWSHRKSSRELLSTSAASWATTTIRWNVKQGAVPSHTPTVQCPSASRAEKKVVYSLLTGITSAAISTTRPANSAYH